MSDKYPGGFVTAGAPAGFSVAFDGSGDYLTVANNAAMNIDTVCSAEVWFYPTVSSADQSIMSGNGNWDFLLNNGNVVMRWFYPGYVDTGVTAVKLFTWHHIAFSISGGRLSFYVNGTRTYTNASVSITNGGSNPTYLGWNGGNSLFPGYLSNARITKGYTPYDPTLTTISLPTQLFPVTGTGLLTCQNPTIVDNSSNAFTVNVFGDSKVSNFTPFAGYTGFNPALGAAAGGVWTLDEAAYYQQNRIWPIYDPYFNQTTLMLHGNGTNGAQNNTFLDSSTNNFTITRNGNTTQGTFTPFSQTGWSNYFSGGYLRTTSSTALGFSTNPLTIEAWVYMTDRAAQYYIVGGSGVSSQVSIKTDGTLVFGVPGVGDVTASTGTVSLNTWTHVAFVRTNSSTGGFAYYINGAQSGTGTLSSDLGTASATVEVGTTNTGVGVTNFTGYISNVRVVKGTAIYTSSFTPSTSPLTAITNTSLLTCQSNRFVDNSAINATFSTVSAASVQAFSPFVPAYITPTTYSNYFSSGNLTTPSSAAFNLSTGDWTIEGWFLLNTNSDDTRLFTVVNSSTDMYGAIVRSGTIRFGQIGVGEAAFGTIALGTWNHIAFSKTSTSTITCYINGISTGTTTAYTLPNANCTVYIAASPANYALSTTNGAISNFRIVKGTAVYTTNFAPPTAPLTNITNTSLLTCQSSTFVDNSTNNFAITATGTVLPVTSPTPFPANVDTTTLNSAYSPALIGGSAYFDGTGDYLTIADTTALEPGSGDFTWEAWIYHTVAAGGTNNYTDQTGGGLAIYREPGGQVLVDSDGVVRIVTSSTAIPINQWVHLAVTRSGTTARIFFNGALNASNTNSTNIAGTSAIGIGGNPSGANLFTGGYMSGIRFIKGTALYTQNFAPPITPPTAVTNTQLLTNFTNGAIFDNTAKNVLETVGTAAISTTQSKYGGSSMYFDGSTSSWLLIPFSRNLDISTGAPDWTLECWGYVVSFANSPYFFNKGGVAAVNYTNYSFSMNSSGVVFCTLGNNGGETSYSFGTCATNTWYHFAATRQGSTIRTFLNGVLVTSQSIATTMTDNGEALYVGCLKNLTSNVLNGYVDDLRITKGYARYVANFTPPTSQLQDQ